MDASLRWHDGNWVRAAWLPLNQPARPADPHQQPVGSVERAFDHAPGFVLGRSEEHTSELQSLMRISYAVFCLTKKNNHNRTTDPHTQTLNRPTRTAQNTHTTRDLLKPPNTYNRHNQKTIV